MSLLDRKNWSYSNHWYTNGIRVAFWDRRARVWTTYLVDAQGNQRTPADHIANRTQFAEVEANGWYEWESDHAELTHAIRNDRWG